MKARKGRRGKKTRKGTFEKKSLFGIVLAIIILCIIFTYSLQHSATNHATSGTLQLKAAIVDHLSLTCPKQTFIQTATNTLKQAGYTVDYYPGEEVTVEFYRNLPTHGYDLIILRVHSAGRNPAGELSGLSLFTSERYSKTKYAYEQWTGSVTRASYSEEDREAGLSYFGISPTFVTNAMHQRFENTVIIMMGCDGLTDTDMAEAFMEKGAKAYISWNGYVLASHTDLATTHLLTHFLTGKLTLKQSVEETLQEIGTDPIYENSLSYYPLTAGDQTIQDITGNLNTNP